MSKTIQIVLPNSNIIQTIIGDSDGALFIYEKIQEVNPGFNEDNTRLKRKLTEDDIKSGEKEYDFGKIRNGEKILVFNIEPCYEKLVDIVYITRLAGFNFNDREYIQGCRYHFTIMNPFYQTKKSLSILYDMDFKKFSLEPSFHNGNYSVYTDLKPFMSTHRPTFDKNYSLNYNPNWYDTLRELLYSISDSDQEGFDSSISEQSIENIDRLYEKHKINTY